MLKNCGTEGGRLPSPFLCSVWRRTLQKIHNSNPCLTELNTGRNTIVSSQRTGRCTQSSPGLLQEEGGWGEGWRGRPKTIYSISIDWRPFPFFRLFICEGDIEYMGCGNTEHRDLKARALPWLPSCPNELEERFGGACLNCDGSLKGLAIPRDSAKMSAASYCQLQLPLVFTFCDVNHQCQAISELCVKSLWYGEQPNAIARQLDFCYTFI